MLLNIILERIYREIMNRFRLSLVVVVIVLSIQMFTPMTNLSLAEQNISWADPVLVALNKSSGPDSGDCKPIPGD